MQRLSIDSPAEAYRTQANALLAAWSAGDADAEKLVRQKWLAE